MKLYFVTLWSATDCIRLSQPEPLLANAQAMKAQWESAYPDCTAKIYSATLAEEA